MKIKIKTFLLIVTSLLIITSCDKNNDEFETVNVATAEYMSLKTLRSSVEIIQPTPIIESGKIYAYNDLVLVNDIEKGIHIIDNSNPKNPVKKAFIKVVSNKDMEIKGDYLFADSLMDLLVFDISDLDNIFEVARLENVFPSYLPMPFVDNLVVDYGDNGGNSGEVIVGWTITQEQRRIDENRIDFRNGAIDFDIALASSESTGQGGSLARFKIVNDYLYAVDSHNINIVDINNLEQPMELEDVHAGFDIETIFNRGENLFLGSMSGMYIYNIANPAKPKFISEFKHGTACDPVVVDDKYAYITLRAGNFCGAFTSSLEIVDVSDIYNIEHVQSYKMENPYGLGVKDDFLFICDGSAGLKVYNKENVNELKLLNTFENINTFDVIPMESHLLLIGDNTLFQYNYSSSGVTLLSEFSLN